MTATRNQLLCAAVLAAGLLLWFVLGTANGLALSPDSLGYLRSARSILHDRSLAGISTLWPPLYPSLIAGWGGLAGDLLLAARGWNAIALLAAASLLFGIAMRLQPQVLPALLLTVLTVLHYDAVVAWLALWSEATFVALLLLNLVLLARSIDAPDRLRWCVVLGMVAGAATLTRYAGVVLIALNAFALVVLPSATGWRQRLRPAAVTSVIALLPLACWVALRGIGQSVSGGGLAIHPPGPAHAEQAERTLAGWWGLPAEFGWCVLFLLAVVAIGWLVRAAQHRASTLVTVLALFVVAYPLFLLVAITFAFANTPLDGRILLPLLPVAMLIILAALPIRKRPLLAALLGLPLAIGMAFPVHDALGYWAQNRAGMVGLGSKHIAMLPLVSALRQIPADWRVATNAPELLFLHAQQPSLRLPRRSDAKTRRSNPQFTEQLAALPKRAQAIAHFSLMRQRGYLASVDEIEASGNFSAVYAGDDGVLWVRRDLIDVLRAERDARSGE